MLCIHLLSSSFPWKTESYVFTVYVVGWVKDMQYVIELMDTKHAVDTEIIERALRFEKEWAFHCSGAWKFAIPLEFSIFLHKYDLKHHHIFMQILEVDPDEPN